MPNVRIIYPNAADDAVLSASPALVATLPPANLQDVSRARVARSAGLANPQFIRGNFNAVKVISSLALVRHNLTSAGTIRLKLFDAANQGGNLLYDSGVVALGSAKAWGEFVWGVDPWGGDSFAGWPVAFTALWFDAVTTALSFELELTDLANPAGYYEAARLFIGAYWSPAQNMSYGHAMQWDETSTQERTGGGTLRTDGEEPYRRWEFDLQWLTQGERAALMNIVRRAGLRQDIFISLFPAEGGEKERDYAGAGKFVAMPGVIHSSALNWRSRDKLVIEEA